MNDGKPTLLIDLSAVQPINEFKHHGGAEYAKIMFYELANQIDDRKVICVYKPGAALDNNIKEICYKKGFKLIEAKNESDLLEIINKESVSIYYSALPFKYFGLFSNKKLKLKLIYTIHGLRGIEMSTDKYEYLFCKDIKSWLMWIFKQLFTSFYIYLQKKRFINLLDLGTQRRIIVPSYHTKYSILSYFPKLQPEDVIVLYSPRKNVECENIESIISSFNVQPKKYFLLILGNRWIKNNIRAVKALDEIYTERTDIDIQTLILGIGNNYNAYSFLKNKRKFLFYDYVDDEILSALYKNAYAFIYPTLNEGFGYPPLEAMKYGTPVLTSAISSVTEICGDAVLYFNPYSIKEIKARILEIIYENEIYIEMSKKGFKRYINISQKQDEMLDKLINFILE